MTPAGALGHRPAGMSETSFPGEGEPIRHDWTLDEVRALYGLPFSDLIVRAQRAPAVAA